MRLAPTILALAAVATIGLPVRPVSAQVTSLTADEFKCAGNMGKALAKFTATKARCVQKCFTAARKTGGPYADCYAPYGGATAACILDPVKGAEAKARAAIEKKCAAGCPECYDCTAGVPAVATAQAAFDQVTDEVYCVERSGATPAKAGAKCEDAVARALVKLAGARTKCFDKCNAAVFRGKAPDGSCERPAPADAAALECLAKADATAALKIDNACDLTAAAPACHDGATGADWVARIGALADALDAREPDGTACDDGIACTGSEFCLRGGCGNGTSTCPQNTMNWCLVAGCNRATGECVNHQVECPESPNPCFANECTGNDGLCRTRKIIEDRDACPDPHTCATDADCEDTFYEVIPGQDPDLAVRRPNAGTIDTCAHENGIRVCRFAFIDCGFADGDPCTRVNPADPVGCIDELMNPVTLVNPVTDCSDGVACTVDSCDSVVGCVHTPSDVACSDGLFCTDDVCDPVLGCIFPATPCDDGIPCTIDACGPTGCTNDATHCSVP